MSRRQHLPVTFPKVEPTPGPWSAVSGMVFAGDVVIADCSLPGSKYMSATNIDEVERLRRENGANARVMATAKDAVALLTEVAVLTALFANVPEIVDLQRRITALLARVEG